MSQTPLAMESSSPAGSDAAAPSRGEHRRSRHGQGNSGGHSAFVPLVIFFVAAAAWSAFQFHQLSLESETLAALRGNQEAQLQQAQKVRATLDTLALETQKLADGGNANARVVVDELRKRGITINRSSGDGKK